MGKCHSKCHSILLGCYGERTLRAEGQREDVALREPRSWGHLGGAGNTEGGVVFAGPGPTEARRLLKLLRKVESGQKQLLPQSCLPISMGYDLGGQIKEDLV